MKETRDKLSNIADILYKGDTTLGMAMMGTVINDLAVVATKVEDEELKNRYINDGLTQCLQAMENNDGTLLADVISYELIEVIDAL
ncbi:MAG: hypothetical protein E7257_06560 [Lachnospiraceae bacterium]|nr:hypothetical protein [Lachnospiraceae bacterium]